MGEPQRTSSGRKQVCFFDKVRVKLVESRSDYSEQQKDLSWYSEAEIHTILLRCFREAVGLETSIGGDAKPKRRHYTSRGLEGLTTKGHQSKAAVIDACVNGVMDEQEILWENDWEDWNRLALASRLVSKETSTEALERAAKDEKAALKIYWLDQKEKMRNSPPALPKRRLSPMRFAHQMSKISSDLPAQRRT